MSGTVTKKEKRALVKSALFCATLGIWASIALFSGDIRIAMYPVFALVGLAVAATFFATIFGIFIRGQNDR